jgi:hypothetical protein
MTDSNITPIRAGADVPTPPPPSFPETVHATLREQLSKLGEAMAMVRVTATAIRDVYDCDTSDALPLDSSLRGAARMLDEIFGELAGLENSAAAEFEEVRP